MQLIDDIIRDVAELPDRTSPDDQPDMMLVTAEELETIIQRRLDVEQHRIVPQAWIDRAMQIEATARSLVTFVGDAQARADAGTGRLYAANSAMLDRGVEAVAAAINLPEPPFAQRAGLTRPTSGEKA